MMRFSDTTYRPDIDGLRAIAVLSVVGFHAFPNWIKGGFVGVDIFFVISGFLISSIIFANLEKETFIFREFYSRRIKRIFPALILVMTTCYLFGWFILLQSEYGELGKNIAGAAGFISNILFWRNSNYWNTNVETEPLLHLWSLGVEEQFYILWPLILYLSWKRRVSLLICLIAITASSFTLNVAFVNTRPAAVFYLPITRFWELGVGAMLAWSAMRGLGITESLTRRLNGSIPRSVFDNIQSIVGVVLIGIALIVIDKEKPFPGWWVLLPTIGAYLIISAGPKAWLNHSLLSHRVLVWFGLISYPLYLWHWPLFAFEFHVLDPRANSIQNALLIVLASVALAALTYRFVERPIRFGVSKRMNAVTLGLLLIIGGITGATTYIFDGFPNRSINLSQKSKFIVAQQKLLMSKEEMDAHRDECSYWSTWQAQEMAEDCVLAGINGTWFLWGDSFAQSLSIGLRSSLPKGYRLAQVTTGVCRITISEGKCSESNRYVLDQIKNLKPEVVVMAVREGHEYVDWESAAGILLGLGVKKVFLIGPAPMWEPSLPSVIANYYKGQTPHYVNLGVRKRIFITEQYLNKEYVHSARLTYISLLDRLCNSDGCLAVVPATSNLTTFDYGHLSVAGSKFVVKDIISPYLK